jgi:predicted small secreted protein
LLERSSSLGGKMKNRKFLLAAAVLVAFALEGCATARGIGEDVQSLGRAIKRVFSD